MKMNFMSVCSGIEAASVAFDPLGWKAKYFSEIEKFPCQLLGHHYPEVPNLGDMTLIPEMIRNGDIEPPEMLVGGTPCFTAGHLVLTEKGYMPIEQIMSGDLVVTHKGRLRKVLVTGSKQAEVGKLSAAGIPMPLVVTEEHPFLSVNWRNQSTKRNNKYAKIEHVSEPEWIAAKDMKGRQWCALTQYEAVSTEIVSTKFTEKEAMYLAGMYLGDGHTRSHTGKSKKSLVLSLNEQKLGVLKEYISEKHFSISYERTSTRITINDTKFCNWLIENFGKLSHEKNIPAWVMSHQYRDLLLKGYLDTDGCRKERSVYIATTSKSLAYGVCDLFNSLSYVASVSFVKTPDTTIIEGRLVNQRDYYQIRAYPNQLSRKSRMHYGYLLRSATDYQPLGTDTVFNIEVEEDNSYVVNGAVVHNCQAFSVAGKRLSLEDLRGNLTLTFCEIANEIDAARLIRGEQPSIIFWENVCGVLNTVDNAFGSFLAGLAGEDEALIPSGKKWTNAGCVFGPQRTVAWRVLDAQYFGVAQRRRRVFVVASARDDINPTEILFEFEGERRDIAPSREARKEITRTIRNSASQLSALDSVVFEPRSADGVPRIGTQEICSTLNTMSDGQRQPCVAYTASSFGQYSEGVGTLRSCGGDLGGGSETLVSIPFNKQRLGEYSTDDVASTCAARDYKDATDLVCVHGTQDPCVSESTAFALGRNNGQENAICYSLQGNMIGRSDTAGPQGSGVGEDICFTQTKTDIHAVAYSFDSLSSNSMKSPNPHSGCNAVDIAKTLDTSCLNPACNQGGIAIAEPLSYGIPGNWIGRKPENGGNAVEPMHDVAPCQTKTDVHGVATGMQVRRLTPVECERLQGFPDGYTDIKPNGKETPDGPRYKALGNSWAVPNVRWIGERIQKAIDKLEDK